MVRRALTIATLIAVLVPAPASALTLPQIKAQGANAADDLSTELGMNLAFSGLEDVTVTGTASDCRRTQKRRGSCAIEAQAANGAWCSGTAVIREARGRLLRSTRAVQCGDVTAD